DFFEAVVHATRDTLPLLRASAPDVLVADILTLAPALAAELEQIPRATLIPHVYPHGDPHFPIYSLGARLARTALGRALWRRAQGPVTRGLELGREELNRTRARLGLQPVERVHGGISDELALVATLPELEYPRRWHEHVRVVDSVSYARTMPQSEVVVCHGGHGTLVRALCSGCSVVACPAVGDMNENAARLDWAGAGVRVPRRFTTPRVLRLAVERALSEEAIRHRARELQRRARGRDSGAAAAQLIEA